MSNRFNVSIYILVLTLLPLVNSFAMEPESLYSNPHEEQVTLEDSLAFLVSVKARDFTTEMTLNDFLSVTEIRLSTKNKITDADFKYFVPLCQFTNITSLDLRDAGLSGEGFSLILKKCGTWDSIVSIDLGGNPLVDNHLTALSAFPNLRNLNIDFHGKDSISLVTGDFFKTLPAKKLRSLWAVGTSLSDENALTILNWDTLQIFSFYGTSISQEILQQLGEAKVDKGAKTWDLRRMQYESKSQPDWLECIKKITYEQGLRNLARALELNLLTIEAYDWAKANDFSVLISSMLSLTDDEEKYLSGAFKNPRS